MEKMNLFKIPKIRIREEFFCQNNKNWSLNKNL